MFFTMSRRWLGIKDGPVANAINDIFEKDRTNEAAAADRGDTPEKISKARSQIIAHINNYDSSNNSQLMQCSLLQSLTLPRSLNDVDNVQCLNRL
ncbi:hypothetical protein NW754_009823 [Fusarium falciforme]|nr:hypothetical protein NW754_009823 [Fusarium falciforme]